MTTTATEPNATGTIGGMVNQMQGASQQTPGQPQGQPQPQTQQEQMVLVPAGFLGNILSGVSGTVGQAVGGYFGNAGAGKAVGDAAAPLLKLIPWSAAPAAPAPQTAQQEEQLVLVPAGFLGDILSSAAGTVGHLVGDLVGDAQTGR